MIREIEQILVLSLNMIFFSVLGYLAYRRFYLILALAPILISVSLRVLSVSYIDLFGPFYSVQLNNVLKPGISSVYMIICYSIFLIPLAIILEKIVFRNYSLFSISRKRYLSRYVDTTFYLLLAIFLFMLYAQLISGSVIPLLDHIERYDFANYYAGPLHNYLFKYGAVFALVLGGQTVYTKLTDDKFDHRAFVCMIMIIIYAFLTGHRFAAYNKFITFFLIPFALLYARSRHRKSITWCRQQERIGKPIFVLMLIGLSIAVLAIVNSYSNVRTDSDRTVFSRIQERLLIQQGELWVDKIQRSNDPEQEDFNEKLKFLFFEPIVQDKNTSIQYLMWQSLGDEAIRLLEIGQQYAGGFPEIFLELFGEYFLYLMLLFGVLTAFVLLIFFSSLRRGKLLSMLFSGFVIYACILTIYNGMVNQYFVLTFWTKILFLILFYFSPSIQIPKISRSFRNRESGVISYD